MSRRNKDKVDLNYLFELTQLITSLSEDVTVKGAVILASQAALMGVQNNFRMTRDIDLNLRNGDVLRAFNIVQHAVDMSSKRGIVKPVRENEKSCSLLVVDDNEVTLAQLDVQFKDTLFKIHYPLPNGGQFRGQSFGLILADKLSVVSSSKGVLPKRIKDLFDVYFISCLYNINYQDVLRHLKVTQRELGNFGVLLDYQNESKSGIKHAYNSYTGIGNKPEFNIVITRVLSFCKPFMREYTGQLYWDKKGGKWS